MNDSIDELKEVLARARTEAAQVVIGQEEAIHFALIAIFTNQHALIEGVPGVAKTLLVRIFCRACFPTLRIRHGLEFFVFKPSSRIFLRESAKRPMQILVCKQGENAAAKTHWRTHSAPCRELGFKAKGT